MSSCPHSAWQQLRSCEHLQPLTPPGWAEEKGRELLYSGLPWAVLPALALGELRCLSFPLAIVFLLNPAQSLLIMGTDY